MNKSSTAYLIECYIWLLNTIARGPISRAAIDEKWAHSSVNDYKQDYIPESNFHRWKDTIQSLFDVHIKCNSNNEYYIEEAADLRSADMRTRLLNLMSVNSLLKDSKELSSQILFEPVHAGEQFLSPIIESLRDKTAIQISYHSFEIDEPKTFTVEPYCLKMYRQRWYLVAFTRERSAIRHFALDRINNLRPTSEIYSVPADFDVEKYFQNFCGITVLKDKPEEIKVAVVADQVPYFRTLPIHSSQKEIETTPNRSIFSYYLVPTEEFYRELRACGRSVLVLSPDWLCQEFRADAKLVYKMYNEISPE